MSDCSLVLMPLHVLVHVAVWKVPARLLPMPLLSGSSSDGSMMTFAPSDDGFYGNMQSGFFRCAASS